MAGRDGGLLQGLSGYLGGGKATNQLSIRFKANLPWTRVEHCPVPSSRHLEHLDAHVASESPGRYTIVLRVDDRPSAREGSICISTHAPFRSTRCDQTEQRQLFTGGANPRRDLR